VQALAQEPAAVAQSTAEEIQVVPMGPVLALGLALDPAGLRCCHPADLDIQR
jgi:hypothetical protein